MDTKTARLQQEREDAEYLAEHDAEQMTYDGVPIPDEPPYDPSEPRLWAAAKENA